MCDVKPHRHREPPGLTESRLKPSLLHIADLLEVGDVLQHRHEHGFAPLHRQDLGHILYVGSHMQPGVVLALVYIHADVIEGAAGAKPLRGFGFEPKIEHTVKFDVISALSNEQTVVDPQH